jgi:hypothetical protein
MKILSIALTALALCGSALAGSADTINVHFSSPVQIGAKTLPAGDVTFNVLRSNTSIILTARAEDGTAAAVLVNRVYDTGETTRTSVVLGRHGKDLKLERIWLDDYTGYAVLNEGQ